MATANLATGYYFEEALAAFQSATNYAGEKSCTAEFASLRIAFRFAGAALADLLLPAIAHNAVKTDQADFTLCCWDSESTHSVMPHPPWPNTVYSAKGHITGYNDARWRTAYLPDMRILHMRDNERKLGLYWIERHSLLATEETAIPFRTHLHWPCKDTPLQLVHGGAAGTDKGAVLLTGPKGSGKTSTALACLDAGMRYAGDDYVMIENAAIPQVHSLYCTAKCMPQSLIGLTVFTDQEPAGLLSTGKAIYRLQGKLERQLTRTMPLRAVIVPIVTQAAQPRLIPASPVEALRALAPTTLMQLEGDTQEAYTKLSLLAKSIPCLRLELGGDNRQAARLIQDYLHG